MFGQPAALAVAAAEAPPNHERMDFRDTVSPSAVNLAKHRERLPSVLQQVQQNLNRPQALAVPLSILNMVGHLERLLVIKS